MNVNAPGDARRIAAELEAEYRRIPKAVAARVVELADNGMTRFEVASITGLPLPMVALILRGATFGVPK